MNGRSDDMAAEFRREKATLCQIDKARDAVRRKYRLLKEGKDTMERALGDTFKPIVDPLERLVSATDTSAREIKDEIKNLIPKKEEENQDWGASSFKTAYDDDEDEGGDESMSKENSSVDKYLHLLNTNRKKFLDMNYGVRKLADGTLMIGDSPISFENEHVHVGDGKYRSSVGLLELLFRKQPDAQLISAEDRNNYGKILHATNAHRKHYSPDEVIPETFIKHFPAYAFIPKHFCNIRITLGGHFYARYYYRTTDCNTKVR